MSKVYSDSSVTVITGALGILGKSYVNGLRNIGHRIVAIDRTPDNEIQTGWSNEENVFYVCADVCNKNELNAALERSVKHFGNPTGLINNAALDTPPDAPALENGPFETYPEESFDRVMAVNVKGSMLCAQVFGSAMAKAGKGSIINIASIYGAVSPDQSLYEYRRVRGETFYKPVSYSVSKSAVYNLTRYLAVYWAKSGVRVNTLTLAGVFNNQEPDFLKAYTSRIPIGRMANPLDYLGPVRFLLSDDSSYMTGADLVVDGGWTAI